ncbi:hypothetical protein HK101_009882 [Irineochytrium annulatum]|nr:hypothetical protein HK101_009882 [Irineochytrium annulatum]
MATSHRGQLTAAKKIGAVADPGYAVAEMTGAVAGHRSASRWLPPNAPLLRVEWPASPDLPNVYSTVSSFLQAFANFSRVYDASDYDAARWMLLCLPPPLAALAMENMSSPTDKSRLLAYLHSLPATSACLPQQGALLGSQHAITSPTATSSALLVELEYGDAQEPVAVTYRQMGAFETVSEHCLAFFQDLLQKTPAAERKLIIAKSAHVNGFIASLTTNLRVVVEKKGPYSSLEHVMREAKIVEEDGAPLEQVERDVKNVEALYEDAGTLQRDDSGVDMHGADATTPRVDIVEKGSLRPYVAPAALFLPAASTAQPNKVVSRSTSINAIASNLSTTKTRDTTSTPVNVTASNSFSPKTELNFWDRIPNLPPPTRKMEYFVARPFCHPKDGLAGDGGIGNLPPKPVPTSGHLNGSFQELGNGRRMPDSNARLLDPLGDGLPSGKYDGFCIDRRGSTVQGRDSGEGKKMPSAFDWLGGVVEDESSLQWSKRKKPIEEEVGKVNCRVHGSRHSNEECLVQNPTADVPGKAWCIFHGWCTHTEEKCVKR